ncbi:MAG: nlhH 2 [Verrucomicrobia bacterium]|nr:nlhH 2 [Verrucomicrobiota bacterium]
MKALARLALLGLIVSAARAQDVGAGTSIDDPTPPRISIRQDLPYDAQPAQKLDLYLPLGKVVKPRPMIVYLHGGGWTKGSKADGKRFAFRFAQRGYVVACIDYRLTSDATFPAQLEDCKAALRWLRSNAERFAIDRDRVGVVGISAGGHLAALLGALNSSRIYETGSSMDQNSTVQAVCDFFGPVDLLRLYDDAQKSGAAQASEVSQLVGGDPHQFPRPTRAANPIAGLDASSPPFLIIHGDRDTVVPLEHSRLLYDALVAKGIKAHLHVIHGAGHTGPAFVAPEINAMVDDFFAKTLKPTETSGELKTAVVTESDAITN